MEWRDIPDFDGYQVSDTGIVRTHNKVTFTERHGFRHWKDRELSPKVGISKRNRGDKRVDLWKNGKPHGFKVARLVAFTFLGEDISNTKLTVNHIDGDFNNNNLSNLEIISLGDNIRHGFDTGLYNCCVGVKVTNKETGESETFRSMSRASKALGKNKGYISAIFCRGETEDDQYYFEKI